jgi:hypothetical protein
MTKEEYKKHIREVFECQYGKLKVGTSTGPRERPTSPRQKPRDKEEQSKHHNQKGGRSNGSRIPN